MAPRDAANRVVITCGRGAQSLVVFLSVHLARAETSNADGVYGRFDSDFALEPALGAEYSRSSILPEVDLSASYVSTLGLRLQHADSRFFPHPANRDRSVSAVNFELRPLFMVRWSQAWESGPAFLDLTLDSLVVGIGAFWDYDRGSSQLRRGSEIMGGIGVPLLARHAGPWLRLSAALRTWPGPVFSMSSYPVCGASLTWNLPVDAGIHNDRH